MQVEYMGRPRVVLMCKGDVFGNALASEFRARKWNVQQTMVANYFKDCDLMIIKSARHPEIISQYTDKGIPVFIYDWGYFKRVNNPNEHKEGYWQLSLNDLNCMPDWDLPPDRFGQTKVKLKEQSNNPDGYVLLCGQMPIDAAVSGSDHKQWLIDQYDFYTSKGLDVRYREHPRGGVALDYPTAHECLITAMRGSRFVVTYSSNVGHDALIEGIPVVCDYKAPYADLSGEVLPNMEERIKYFSRAAYGQWMHTEGKEAIDFLLNEWVPKL